jgi:hypothetical protein
MANALETPVTCLFTKEVKCPAHSVLARPPNRACRGRPAALHVTDDTSGHRVALRVTRKARSQVSLSHRCTMEHHDATGVSPRDKRCES